MGILGQYMGKTYIEVKNRPIYLASIVETEEEQEESETLLASDLEASKSEKGYKEK